MQLETLEQRCAALQRRHGKRRERLAGRAARIRKEQRSQAAAAAKGRAAGGGNANTPSRQHEGAVAMGPPAGTPAKGTPVRAVSEVDVGGEGAEDEQGVNSEPLVLWAEQKGRGKLAAVVGSVSVSPGLTRVLKEHQRDAVRFVWSACFAERRGEMWRKKLEPQPPSPSLTPTLAVTPTPAVILALTLTLPNIRSQKKVEHGCVLAHSMGLGKTLSVIAFLHTALTRARNSEGLCYAHYRGGRPPAARGGPDGPRPPRALVLVPKSVCSQWIAELRHWLSPGADVEPLHCLMLDTGKGALAQLRRWRSEGGVVVMSHNLFMSLAKPPTAQAQRRNAAAAAAAAPNGPAAAAAANGAAATG